VSADRDHALTLLDISKKFLDVLDAGPGGASLLETATCSLHAQAVATHALTVAVLDVAAAVRETNPLRT